MPESWRLSLRGLWYIIAAFALVTSGRSQVEKRESIALYMTCRTQKETLKLKHMQASQFAMPKCFLERFWVHTIEMLGCANLSSTGYGKSSHKALKRGISLH